VRSACDHHASGCHQKYCLSQKTGLLIQPGNAEQLFQAIDVMVSDKALASRLGLAARKSVQRLVFDRNCYKKISGVVSGSRAQLT
jgi:glycosyltransferase involved in cell wall biosynthesis